jgi:hypothetical protein
MRKNPVTTLEIAAQRLYTDPRRRTSLVEFRIATMQARKKKPGDHPVS